MPRHVHETNNKQYLLLDAFGKRLSCLPLRSERSSTGVTQRVCSNPPDTRVPFPLAECEWQKSDGTSFEPTHHRVLSNRSITSAGHLTDTFDAYLMRLASGTKLTLILERAWLGRFRTEEEFRPPVNVELIDVVSNLHLHESEIFFQMKTLNVNNNVSVAPHIKHFESFQRERWYESKFYENLSVKLTIFQVTITLHGEERNVRIHEHTITHLMRLLTIIIICRIKFPVLFWKWKCHNFQTWICSRVWFIVSSSLSFAL